MISELYYPDDNIQKNKYTVLVESKIYSWIDIEASNEYELKLEVEDLKKKDLLESAEQIELISSYIDSEDGEKLFNYSEEDMLRKRVKELEKKLAEIKEFYGEKEIKV